MREGLAREFPGALRAVAWTRARVGRRLVLWDEPVVWATISGIGAGFLVAAVAAVALGAGGLAALVLDVVYVAAGIALRVPGAITFCERSGGANPFPGPDQCTAVGFLASLWPQFVGIGLGIVLARTSLITRGEGTNSLLRVAGALALALFVVTAAWGIAVAQSASAAETAGGSTSALTIAAGIAAAAVAAGALAAQLPRGVRNAAIVAAVWLVPWFALQVPFASRSLTESMAAENVIAIVTSIVIEPIAAAFLVLSAAVASRARFIPRDPA